MNKLSITKTTGRNGEFILKLIFPIKICNRSAPPYLRILPI